jgi:hypothetical protein
VSVAQSEMLPVPARNSVHIEIIDVGLLLLLSLPLPMFTLFLSFLGTLRSCFQTRAALQLEILALRHQINVLRRLQCGHVRLSERDRLLWAWLLHLWSDWRSAFATTGWPTCLRPTQTS